MICLKQDQSLLKSQKTHISTQKVLNQLMKNVHMAQSKRQQIIKNHSKSNTFSKAHYNLKTTNKAQKQNEPLPEEQITNQQKDQQKITTNVQPFKKSQNNLQSSTSYLNIKEQYVHQNDSKSINEINEQKIPKYNNHPHHKQHDCSIQLSQSVQESQEMLLQNSISSKFLQSPTLSLALIESKITKKSVKSHTYLRNKQLNQNHNNKQLSLKDKKNQIKPNLQTKQDSFDPEIKLSKKSENEVHKMGEDLMFLIDSNGISSVKQIQQLNNNDSKQIQVNSRQLTTNQQMRIKSKINNLFKKQQPTIMLLQTNTNSSSPYINDQQQLLKNEIMLSYQMEIEYLRKINLIQSMEIEKLRNLLRITKSKSIIQLQHNNNQSCENNNQNKHNKKKAIDIIKNRQPHINSTYQPNNKPIKQTKNNHSLQHKVTKTQIIKSNIHKKSIKTKTHKINPLHQQSLSIQTQIPTSSQQCNFNKFISQTQNTKITTNQSINSDSQTQDIFQQYIIQHNSNHINKNNKNNHVKNNHVKTNNIKNTPLNDQNLKTKNHQSISLNEIDINSSLTLNNHNVSCYSQSTCKKITSNKKSHKINSSCQKNVTPFSKSLKNKQNIECRTLSMKKKESKKRNNKKGVYTIDLLDSIKKQLSYEDKKKPIIRQ